MLPEAKICHSMAGRLRVKIPAKKGDGRYFAAMAEHFSKLEGIVSVEINPLTGSMLFVHGLDETAIAASASSNGLFLLDRSRPANQDLHKRVTEAFSGIDAGVKGLTFGNMNTGAVAFLALAGIGIYQISRGNFAAPAWYTAFWYAFNIFLKSKPE